MKPQQESSGKQEPLEDDHPFKRLASATKRLLAVPKGEVEEKAEEERAKKEHPSDHP
jgi:hypothetical protein